MSTTPTNGAQHHATRSGYRRRNRISGQFSPRMIEMLESPAYRVLSLSAHRVISRIEIELGQHGGNNNGRLPITKLDFVDYGVHNAAVAPAIREAEALGFIKVERGRGGNSDHHQPNLFRLTFAHDRNSRSAPPTHDWRRIKTLEEAETIARAARAIKSAAAVSLGRRAAVKNRNRLRKPYPKPVTETVTENGQGPVTETVTTGQGRKPYPLSISRGGGVSRRGRQPCSDPSPVSPRAPSSLGRR